jgi:hypothetical protein
MFLKHSSSSVGLINDLLTSVGCLCGLWLLRARAFIGQIDGVSNPLLTILLVTVVCSYRLWPHIRVFCRRRRRL